MPDLSNVHFSGADGYLQAATSTHADGNNVDIDPEMQHLSQPNLTYSALTQVLSSRLGILRSVVNGR